MSEREVIRTWWRRALGSDAGKAKALGARLRRADHVSEVLAHREVIELADLILTHNPRRLALVAQVLACVREDKGGPLARKFGAGGEDSALSALRFERLIQAPDDDALRAALRRALPMVKNTCDVGLLGQDLTNWGEDTRNTWIFQYFQKSVPKTGAEEEAKT